MSPKVGGLLSWSVQLDSPETALTVGGWIRPRGQNYWGREAAILTHPPQKQQCSIIEALTGSSTSEGSSVMYNPLSLLASHRL